MMSVPNWKKGREQEQVWDAVIQLFDEMVEMAGEEKYDIRYISFRHWRLVSNH